MRIALVLLFACALACDPPVKVGPVQPSNPTAPQVPTPAVPDDSGDAGLAGLVIDTHGDSLFVGGGQITQVGRQDTVPAFITSPDAKTFGVTTGLQAGFCTLGWGSPIANVKELYLPTPPANVRIVSRLRAGLTLADETEWLNGACGVDAAIIEFRGPGRYDFGIRFQTGARPGTVELNTMFDILGINFRPYIIPTKIDAIP